MPVLNPTQAVELRAELINDPNNYGYAPFRIEGNDAALVIMLNHIRDGATIPTYNGQNLGVAGAALPNRPRRSLPNNLVIDAILGTDLVFPTGTNAAAIAAIRGAFLNAILVQPTIDLANDTGGKTRTRDNLDAVIGGSSQNRFNTIAARSQSRSEHLFGYEVRIDDLDVARALRPDDHPF